MSLSTRRTKVKQYYIFIVFFLFLLVVVGFSYPKIVNYQWRKTGNRLKPEIIQPISLEDRQAELQKKIELLGVEIPNEFKKNGDDLVATLSSGTTLIIRKDYDPSFLLASLHLIFKNIRIEGKWPLIIDLRFSRPILSY